MTVQQLALDLGLPRQRDRAYEQETEYLRLGILRHRRDLTNHQHGWIVTDWDTAARPEPHSTGHLHKGDLIPAWVCCQCGEPEPNAYWLQTGHACEHNVRGIGGRQCAARRLGGRRVFRHRFARPVHALRVWGRFLPGGARRPEVVTYGQVSAR